MGGDDMDGVADGPDEIEVIDLPQFMSQWNAYTPFEAVAYVRNVAVYGTGRHYLRAKERIVQPQQDNAEVRGSRGDKSVVVLGGVGRGRGPAAGTGTVHGAAARADGLDSRGHP